MSPTLNECRGASMFTFADDCIPPPRTLRLRCYAVDACRQKRREPAQVALLISASTALSRAGAVKGASGQDELSASRNEDFFSGELYGRHVANLDTYALIRDPDGFFVQLIQPDPLPAGSDDILGGAVQLSIEDSAKTVAFLRDAIGFNARPTGQLGSNAVVANLINLPGAQWRITHGSISGTTLDFGLIEYVGVPRVKFALGAEDPGSPAFTMVVRDIDAAVDQWKKAGGTVATTGGQAVKGANGAGNVFVRDVNGFMWELIQRARQ